MFVRVKKIKGNEYAYLVSNQWTSKGPRQKTQGYLGRVVAAETSRVDESKLSPFPEGEYKALVDFAIKDNLSAIGFSESEGKMISGDIAYDPAVRQVRWKGRPCVLKLNEGLLSEHTIETVRSFVRSGEDRRDILIFAESIVAAGIKLTKDVFVKLYTALPKPEMEEKKLADFEY